MTPFVKFIIVMNIVSFLTFLIDRLFHDSTDKTLFPLWVYIVVTMLFGSIGVNIYFLLFYSHFSLAGHKYREVRDVKDHYLIWRIFAIVMLIIHVIVFRWLNTDVGIGAIDKILATIISSNMFLKYLLVINIVAFIMFFVDKQLAINYKSRISELVLLLIAAVGGSIGALLSMQIFRHKTQKLTFTIGMPLIIAAQIIALVYFIKVVKQL